MQTTVSHDLVGVDDILKDGVDSLEAKLVIHRIAEQEIDSGE